MGDVDVSSMLDDVPVGTYVLVRTDRADRPYIGEPVGRDVSELLWAVDGVLTDSGAADRLLLADELADGDLSRAIERNLCYHVAITCCMALWTWATAAEAASVAPMSVAVCVGLLIAFAVCGAVLVTRATRMPESVRRAMRLLEFRRLTADDGALDALGDDELEARGVLSLFDVTDGDAPEPS